MATPTVPIGLRISVEDEARKDKLKREGIGCVEIFLAGLDAKENEVKIKNK